MSNSPIPEAPGEVLNEIAFDRDGNPVDITSPAAHHGEIEYRDHDGEIVRTYWRNDGA